MGYTLRNDPEEANIRTWFTDEGDGLGLFLFTVAPDLPTVCTFNDLREFYEAEIRTSGARLVELSRMDAAGCPAIRLIFKTPQQPSGMTYVGSITVPFRDFSFVVKVQCPELGTTGTREAKLMLETKLLSRLTMQDIHDENALRRIVEAAQFDGEQFDDQFPRHPLSRARRVLKRVCSSVFIEPEIAACPRFPLPKKPLDSGPGSEF